MIVTLSEFKKASGTVTIAIVFSFFYVELFTVQIKNILSVITKFYKIHISSSNWSTTNHKFYTKSFHKKLQKEFPSIPVEKVDERYTSKLAVQAMIEMGMKKKDRQKKGNVDQIAAAIMLQEYLRNLL